MEASNSRQSQLGFQLDENISSAEGLDKLVKRRTNKGASLPTESSENVRRGLQGLMDRQLKQERKNKDLDTALKVSATKLDEMHEILRVKNLEVEAMRLGFRRTESLLLNRIESDSLSHIDAVLKSPEHLLLKEKINSLRIVWTPWTLLPLMQDYTTGIASSSTTDTADLYKSLENIFKDIEVLRTQVGSSSATESSEFGKPIRLGDSMMGGPSDITAYLKKNSELTINTGFLIGYDIIL